MKLSLLLSQRRAMLRQARLANLAFAYDRLAELSQRISRVRLTGLVCLRQTAQDADQFWASLTMLRGSQAVLDEHFADEDIMDFAEAVAWTLSETELDETFPIEHIEERFVAPLRSRLIAAGVTIDREHERATPPVSNPLDAFGGACSDEEL